MALDQLPKKNQQLLRKSSRKRSLDKKRRKQRTSTLSQALTMVSLVWLLSTARQLEQMMDQGLPSRKLREVTKKKNQLQQRTHQVTLSQQMQVVQTLISTLMTNQQNKLQLLISTTYCQVACKELAPWLPNQSMSLSLTKLVLSDPLRKCSNHNQ